jgi:hypothetical protein
MRGLLLTMTEPPLEMEEEFNAWYDTEHIPERNSITGFISSRRWTLPDAKPGDGKYLATYELESPEALTTPEYMSHVGDNFTPWSKRCLRKATVFRRWALTETGRAHATMAEPAKEAARALFISLGDIPVEHEEEFNRWYNEEHVPLISKVPGVLRARRFFDLAGKPRYVALYELAGPQVRQQPEWQAAVTTPWTKRIRELQGEAPRLVRTYLAYD